MKQNNSKMTETLANGYSSESTQRELSNEYQYDRVSTVFRKLCIFVLWMEVASASEGLRSAKQTKPMVDRETEQSPPYSEQKK